MILLLGASGYIGQAWQRELSRRNRPFTCLSRKQVDYTRFDLLLNFLRQLKPSFVINAAGFAGKPNIDSCELARAETLKANCCLPLTVAEACCAAGIPWGHVSSGCIYSGSWVVDNGTARIEKDLTTAALRTLVKRSPHQIRGYSEDDEPNFSFRQPPCSFYSGSKALAEEVIAGLGQGFIWRIRLPFDEFDHPRNYLTKLLTYPKVYDNVNSFSHRGESVRACLELWEMRAPFGTYNVTNPGFMTACQIVARIQQIHRLGREFDFWMNDEEFYRLGAKAPRSNCVLDASKLLATGVKVRPVADAVTESLLRWTRDLDNS